MKNKTQDTAADRKAASAYLRREHDIAKLRAVARERIDKDEKNRKQNGAGLRCSVCLDNDWSLVIIMEEEGSYNLCASLAFNGLEEPSFELEHALEFSLSQIGSWTLDDLEDVASFLAGLGTWRDKALNILNVPDEDPVRQL